MLNFGRLTTNRFARVSLRDFTRLIGCPLLEIFRAVEPLGELGGGEGSRTPDLRLAKPALCQLSYAPKTLKGWLRGRDLNPRPLGYEPNELPDCSTPRHPFNQSHLVGLGRFELPTSRLSGVRSNQLSYRPVPLMRPVFGRKKEPHYLRSARAPPPWRARPRAV